MLLLALAFYIIIIVAVAVAGVLWRADTRRLVIVVILEALLISVPGVIAALDQILGLRLAARWPELLMIWSLLAAAWQSPYFLYGLVGLLLLGLVACGIVIWRRLRPPDKVIILVANFDKPGYEDYHVTDTVLTRLRLVLAKYRDVQVATLGRTVTEPEGSAVARAEGQKRKAAIVIWGWYGKTEKVAPLSVHFELLRPPPHFPDLGPEAKGLVRTMAVAELESFTLQTSLSEEMAYLSLVTVGIARYAAEDWKEAEACFSDALEQTMEPVSALDQIIVHFYRGNARHFSGQLELAIADYDRAIQLRPDYAGAYYNRGLAHAKKGELELAIADYDRAIQLRPDDAGAYNNRGVAHAEGGS